MFSARSRSTRMCGPQPLLSHTIIQFTCTITLPKLSPLRPPRYISSLYPYLSRLLIYQHILLSEIQYMHNITQVPISAPTKHFRTLQPAQSLLAHYPICIPMHFTNNQQKPSDRLPTQAYGTRKSSTPKRKNPTAQNFFCYCFVSFRSLSQSNGLVENRTKLWLHTPKKKGTHNQQQASRR
jgi:hypothetical protein